MAFSMLIALSQAEYSNLRASFDNQPTKTKSGTPDTRATISLGGWATGTLMKFAVQIAAGSGCTLSIVNPENQTITLTVADAPSAPAVTLYYSIECGATDAKLTDWTINFDVMANNRSTGTWVFRKGGSGDPS